MKRLAITTAFSAFLTLTACNQVAQQQAQIDEPDATVLARVGQSEVNEMQLTAMLEKFASNLPEQNLDQIENVVLQGLVRTRALAQVTEQQLSESDRELIEARVQNYRDELLVQAYIQNNVEPRPVTTAMVREYYEQHIEQYAIPGKLRFDYLVTTETDLTDSQMAAVMDALTTARNRQDWTEYAQSLQQQQLPLSLRSGYMPLANINQTLRSQLVLLEEGETSDVVFADNIFLLRLIEREADSYQPLHEVSNNIRKQLAPQQLKQTLAMHIDEAVNKIGVEYLK